MGLRGAQQDFLLTELDGHRIHYLPPGPKNSGIVRRQRLGRSAERNGQPQVYAAVPKVVAGGK